MMFMRKSAFRAAASSAFQLQQQQMEMVFSFLPHFLVSYSSNITTFLPLLLQRNLLCLKKMTGLLVIIAITLVLMMLGFILSHGSLPKRNSIPLLSLCAIKWICSCHSQCLFSNILINCFVAQTCSFCCLCLGRCSNLRYSHVISYNTISMVCSNWQHKYGSSVFKKMEQMGQAKLVTTVHHRHLCKIG
uniref:Uncharacterized protein n=1 Tax=Salix viminalis TaxID=40686 RepID=A0A6N2MQ82_SALVM